MLSRSRQRFALLLGALVLVILVSALLYMLGMRYLEGEPRTFVDSLGWAAETLTTTGYGADARWRHPLMLAFVIALQFVGVFLVFLVVPIYLIPFLEERFQTRLPQAAPDMRDHVVIYRYGPAVATLLPHLTAAGIPTLVIEEDEGTARRLAERGVRIVHRTLEETSLADVAMLRARALVANGSDTEDAVIVLAARQLGFQGPILALVEEPFHRRPIMLAGASVAFTPRHILGAALAARASERIEPRVSGAQQLGRSLRVSEIRIRPQSPVANRTLEQAGVGARTGATVIGQWVGGELIAPPAPSMMLAPNGLLVVLSSEESLARLEALVEGAARQHRSGPFVIAGFGEVGGKVAELLRVAGEEVWVLDRHERPGVDMAGDMLDPDVLPRAPIEQAQAVILALDTDSATLFATTILKDYAPDVPVIARVNQAGNVDRIYRAGADFALSISQVSAQMLARHLLGEEAVEVDEQLKVLKVPVEPLIGRHPSALRIRERTGCSVVAVERGDEAILEFAPGFRFEAGDTVFVTGTAEAVRRFQERLS